MRYYKTILTGIIALVLLASCESLRRMTAKDNSASGLKTKKTTRKKVEFIDGIEVTPGSVVTSKHRIGSSRHVTNGESITYTKPDPAFKEVNIEKADWLQLKYAIMMDATVEKLVNVPLLQKMEEWWGTKYCMGGNTKNCIDCSAFTQTVMADVYNIKLPRTAQEQYDMSEKIEDTDLKEGDLVFFHTGGRKSRDISHVGIYITNSKFANASTSGGVTISDLNDPYWKIRYKGAGRVSKE
jgi:lipoprotein Spr